MSEGLLGEVTATWVLKNRENGWLKYALQVLAAGPYLRSAMIGELCEDVKPSLERRLPGHDVAADTTINEGAIWFSVDITRDVWGELGVSLANWKTDASEVAISVYNYGEDLSGTASAQIRDCLAKKRTPFHRKREPKYVWNVWLDRRNWANPEFLVRLVDDREVVVGEVTKDLLEIVELTDDVLKRLAKADSV